MFEDDYLKGLREEARRLRHDVDEFAQSRVAARVRSRINVPAVTPAQCLARWFAPLTATLSAIALAATISVVLVQRAMNVPPSVEQLSSASAMEISAAGDIYRVGN